MRRSRSSDAPPARGELAAGPPSYTCGRAACEREVAAHDSPAVRAFPQRPPTERRLAMSRRPVTLTLSTVLLLAAFAMPAAAQGTAPVCTSPLDPACNHLKCYQIKDKA